MGINIQQPMGPGNGAFTYDDLLLTMQQNAWTTVVYFPGHNTTNIICENSVLNPAIQWCAPKASTWEPPAYIAVVIPPIVCAGTCGTQTPPGTIIVPPYVPPVVTTPEPSLVWVTLFIIFVIILLRGPSVWRNHREGR